MTRKKGRSPPMKKQEKGGGGKQKRRKTKAGTREIWKWRNWAN